MTATHHTQSDHSLVRSRYAGASRPNPNAWSGVGCHPVGVAVVLGLSLLAGRVQAELSHDEFGAGTNLFTISFVTIGDPGNEHDPVAIPYPLGGVGYRYRMGRYEVSESILKQANALGGLGITTSDWGTNKPATLLTFYEVARFVNWLNTSTGHPPAYRFNARGEWLLWSEDEAWRLDGVNLYRHKDAYYFLPSADEWYKAAYYNGTNYLRYATGSNSTPTPVARGTDPRTTVYAQAEEVGPADVDDAGGLSPYNTMAQGGNVWEWTESTVDGVNDRTDLALQVRGGSWTSGSSSLRGSSSNSGRPWQGDTGTAGFRVASLPRLTPDAPYLTLQPDPGGGGLEISFVSQTGVDYDIERANSPGGDYVTIETLSGTGGVVRYVFKPQDSSNAFYRVVATRVGF